jgi:hypothetical protein
MSRRNLLFLAIFVLLSVLLIRGFLRRADLGRNEEIIFLPASASLMADGSWDLPVHAWIFESEEEDWSRLFARRALGALAELFSLGGEDGQDGLFRSRIKYFLVDNKRGKRPRIAISSPSHSQPLEARLRPSAANGHSITHIIYRRREKEGAWLTLAVKGRRDDRRVFMGQARMVPPQGLSVICDIDDTIRISNVLNRKALLRNMFFKPFRPVRSMARYLWELERKGAYFHYVSASPWRLYPGLARFMDNHAPRGSSFSMRYFRLKDKSLSEFFGSSRSYKLKAISAIINRYEGHKFILIGDSGEKDPEIYGQIYREHPRNIKAIVIRRVAGADNREQRFLDAFAHVPPGLWRVSEFPP